MLTIPTKLLNAINQFASKKDVRYYLNGVLLELRAGVVRLVATDGTIAAACVLPDATDLPDGEWIMPNAMVDAIIKAKANNVVVAFGPDSVEKGTCATLSVNLNGAQMSYRSVEGKFPQWRRVIANAHYEEVPANFDAALLGVIARASKLSGSSKWGYFGLRPQGSRSALFSIEGSNIVGVIAPLNPNNTPLFNATLFDDVINRTAAEAFV